MSAGLASIPEEDEYQETSDSDSDSGSVFREEPSRQSPDKGLYVCNLTPQSNEIIDSSMDQYLGNIPLSETEKWKEIVLQRTLLTDCKFTALRIC